jgi:hypothetical protein
MLAEFRDAADGDARRCAAGAHWLALASASYAKVQPEQGRRRHGERPVQDRELSKRRHQLLDFHH